MKKIIILIGLIILTYTLGWISSVGMVWVIQWLVNVIFDTEFAYNVWFGGLLFYIVWLLFQPTKS